ncbi:DUF1800 domain-containing protein [Frigoriflavimonas asaccharolytica]|uniref:Uncharacterized protein (DUF1800 family) n=1 Tax=Frigoriflavimonas asaccharolytica TaxID=2735899 RepID=A0A8J8G8D8_9FLAO|nr:DUF1800 domain-containing protein [Frigoriflavimonas asaccharolytica]NRS92585.1 uncharacterized protein (DUF1800 family) [Frigoriflavimonas asaccharolytica]
MTSSFLKNKHLLWRAGFGPNLSDYKNLENIKTSDLWNSIIAHKEINTISFTTQIQEKEFSEISKLDAEQRKTFQQLRNKQNTELNHNFFMTMVQSENQFLEKMAFFWHGHFACKILNAPFNQQLLQVIRENALGNFGDLLIAVSKSPAMLSFLNNQQNKKAHPNENFAREVMELFTLGTGNYTETDIKEAARSFTGWSYDKDGAFIERKGIHDENSKKFLGKEGNFDGTDILNIILEKKETAKFITKKIYKYFVNEKIDERRLENLSNNFYNSKYDIKKLMTEIFTSNWFFEDENIGNKIKSPIELMVGILRTLPTSEVKMQSLMMYQKLLGQTLFYPPNVAGWPTGKSWIDSSTLLLRMKLPQIWSGSRALETTAKADDDVEMGLENAKKTKKNANTANFNFDWQLVQTTLADKNISESLLQKTKSLDKETIKKYAGEDVKKTIIEVMSTPEYQLC